MRTIEIPRNEWGRRLDEFSSAHDGSLVSVEVLAPEVGAQPQIRAMPLRGVTADADTSGPAITIVAERGNGDEITHIIHQPTHVRLERTNEGDDVALEIESGEGTTAILRFNSAA